MTTAGYHYRVMRTELIDGLAPTLTEEQLGAPVPALPGWDVLDTYAHLAGISADFVAGTPGDPNNPAWSAGHIAARKGRTLSELCEEWTANSPTVETILDMPEGRRLVLAVFDVFHHGHDIRGALGNTEQRDTPEAAFVTTVMAKAKRGGWAAAGRPPIELSSDAGTWRFGEEDGEPIATLATTDFELSRILIGRRSRAQMLAARDRPHRVGTPTRARRGA